MPELHLQRSGSMLDVILGEYKSSFPLTDVAQKVTTWEDIYDDAVAYGRDLFDKTFRDEQVRAILSNLPANERLLLVVEDPLLAAIPWEYLRDPNNKLLASRLNFVRAIPEEQRRENFSFAGSLEIVAIPVSTVDEPRILNVEGEWKNLVKAITVTSPPKSLTLKRVRPPTRSQLERSLSQQCISIVHFMGHSTSHAGKAFLALEDARARSHLIDAADFADSLNSRVFLVVLNSCLSAVVASTEFGNIAQGLVYRGIPYALGMQFILPDAAALVLSDALYDFLLQGHNVEEAVMHTRRALEEPGKLANPAWLAGIPVLYTGLRAPALPIELTAGLPTIQPNPQRLEKTRDFTALPPPPHFVGRGNEISEVLDALLAHRPADFVALHGLGGIGKTALAQVVAERIGWYYGDWVLAVSFETFAYLNAENQLIVNEQFADRFYNLLAHFYNLDPAEYNTTVDLQRAILQRRLHLRSLLVLDNIETLVDAQRRGHPTAKALATFISRLKEGDGAILITSRIIPPSDWGKCKIISLSGLADDAGGSLLLALMPPERRSTALPDMHKQVSRRVKGHPLSIRLLAGRFAESTVDLETFLQTIEGELKAAEQTTPTSLEDPERQTTLYACMDYSVKRLTPEQRKVLDAISLFQAPFTSDFATRVLIDNEQTPLYLQDLVRLGLLTRDVKLFKEGELELFELHPMLRWYIHYHLLDLDADLLERYGQVFEQLARQSYQREGGYDQNSLMRYMIRQSLPDLEAALRYLQPAGRGALAYHLATPYQRLGQNRRALTLYEQALELYQELRDARGVAMAQRAMAYVLWQLGRPQESLKLYEQSLHIDQQLGDIPGVAVTRHGMAEVLQQLGKPQEALTLYEQSLHIYQQLGDIRSVAATQHTMADVLQQLGKPQEALALYKQSLHATQQLGDIRSVAATQLAMADVLRQLGKPQEAMVLYEQALRTHQELGEVRSVAVTQSAMANVLQQLGRPQEALKLYEQSLHATQQLGDIRSVAATQLAIANVLRQLGKPQEALALYEQALRIFQELGFVKGVAVTQNSMADVLQVVGKPQEALALYEQSLHAMQQLGDILNEAMTQSAMAGVLQELGKPQEALKLYEQSLRTKRQLGDSRNVAITQRAMAGVLQELGKPQEALKLYEQSLRILLQVGDIRNVAVTQANFCQLLLQQGEHRRAMRMAWEAYTSLNQNGFTYDVQMVQQLLRFIKGQFLGPARFDTLWKEVISEPQPGWLRDAQQTSSSPTKGRLSPEQLKVIVANTIEVMTRMPEKREKWRETMSGVLQKAQSVNQSQDVEFFTAILAILDNQAPSLPEGHPYTGAINSIQAGIAAGG
jgi:tetratricopeptide (TPR) repeat protein